MDWEKVWMMFQVSQLIGKSNNKELCRPSTWTEFKVNNHITHKSETEG